VLLAIRNMGGESEAAWRALLDNLVARGLAAPDLVIVDGGSGLEKALAGLPGTGKTLFASALSRSCKIPLVSASYADWQSGDKHMGQVMKNMRESFSNARDAARASGVGAILFIDELDSMPGRDHASGDRHASWWSSIVNTLLTLSERGSPARRGVVLIGATIFADRIDPALRRAGRLDRTIVLRAPDTAAFAAMLRTHLGADLPGPTSSRWRAWRPG
jgi:SpoVK/Ycf46/Vps4 family AAA+-type ATPase